MGIRKQDNELRLSDIAEFPVWEYALDEEGVEKQDERTLRPCLQSPPINPTGIYLLVRASFGLADGTRLTGVVKPIVTGKRLLMNPIVPVDLDPIVITNKGRVVFWYGTNKPGQDEIDRNYSILGCDPKSVFPITFKTDVDVLESIIEGTLDGFLYCEGLKNYFRMEVADIKVVR